MQLIVATMFAWHSQLRVTLQLIQPIISKHGNMLQTQMNNTGLLSPIPIPIQYSSLNQQYQYNPNTNTIPINFNYSVLFFLTL